MDAKLIAESEALLEAVSRLQKVGLIINSSMLSPEHRRAAFALQCVLSANLPNEDEPKRAPIGFEYPDAG